MQKGRRWKRSKSGWEASGRGGGGCGLCCGYGGVEVRRAERRHALGLVKGAVEGSGKEATKSVSRQQLRWMKEGVECWAGSARVCVE